MRPFSLLQFFSNVPCSKGVNQAYISHIVTNYAWVYFLMFRKTTVKQRILKGDFLHFKQCSSSK